MGNILLKLLPVWIVGLLLEKFLKCNPLKEFEAQKSRYNLRTSG